MKKTLFHLFLAISFAQTLNAQVVNIPDANFKNALLQNPEINTNGDNEIQVSEAVAYSNAISVIQKNIKSLIGIEAFVNIKKLNCFQNQLTTLDVSKNIALKVLDCYQNQLIALDVSKNIALTDLDCSENQLTALDVSKNTMLTSLWCPFNQLTILNVKNGTNIKLLDLNATNNSQLKCVQVDNPNKIVNAWDIDEQAIYSSNCSVSTNDNTAIIPQFNLYPNPASQTLHIDWQGDATTVTITLYNSIGAAVKTQQLPQQGSINIADLPRGLYLCRINNANHQSQTTKVVVE